MNGLGLVFAAIAIVFFGSNFVVTKKYKTGDGLFFQWIMASAILVVGFIVWLVRNPTPNHVFEPAAALGGVLWCTGNLCVVPCVKCIGLGLGMVIWGATNMLTGWASGRFGLFGLHSQPPSKPTLNSVGIVVAVFALFLFMLVKPEPPASKKRKGDLGEYEFHTLNAGPEPEEGADSGGGGDDSNEGFFGQLPPFRRRVIGVVLALVSGVLYGSNFNPPQFISDHSSHSAFTLGKNKAPSNLVDYVLPHFLGIYFASTAYFMLYCAVTKNKPWVSKELCLPAWISGIMWAIAQSSWFVANEKLSLPIAFPLVSVGPGLIASLWGVFVFGEIKGTRNFAILGTAFAISITSSILIAMSH